MTDKKRAQQIRNLISGRCYIHDREFGFGMSMRLQQALLHEMAEAGYHMGKDEEYENEWWPPTPPLRTCVIGHFSS